MPLTLKKIIQPELDALDPGFPYILFLWFAPNPPLFLFRIFLGLFPLSFTMGIAQASILGSLPFTLYSMDYKPKCLQGSEDNRNK